MKISKSIRKLVKRRIPDNVRKGILTGCIIAIMVLPAVFVNNIFGYLPGIAVIVGISASAGYMMLLNKALAYEELSDLSNCQRGTEVEFKVRLKNRSILVFPKVEPYFYISDLFGGDDSVTASVITLAPKETREFAFSVRFDHIGTYSAGLKKVVIYDLLGLFSKTVSNNKAYTVNVAPRIFDVAKLQISNSTLTESKKMTVPTMIDGTDYSSVREYVIGDPIRNIHWKLSARTENYMTKQFETYGNTGIEVILDFLSPEYDAETLMSIFDCVVETGLSVGRYAEENGLEYELLYYNRKNVRCRASVRKGTDYTSLIQDMPKITTSRPQSTAADLLREECNALYSQGNIALCTANITEETTEVLVDIKNRRKNPVLFAVIPDELTGQERDDYLKPLKILDKMQITYYILFSAEALKGEKC